VCKEGASPSVDLPGGRRTARANRSTLMAKSSKKGACSAHTVAAKGNCLQHARREGNIPSYVNPHLTHMNRTVFEDPSISRRKSIIPLKREAERNYKAKTGQKCQKSFAPFRETCLVVRADVTDEQLKLFKQWTEQLTGWTGLGMWLHLDEGHKKSKYIEGDEGFKLNVHVHALWRCVDPATGKAIRCDRTILSKMQDLLAKATGMERGNRASETGRRGRSAKEERILQQEQRIAQLDAKITQLKEENDRLQGENQELRKENARLKVAKAVKSKVLSIVGSSRIDELEDELKRMDGMLQQTAKAKAKAEREAIEASRTLSLEREANKKTVAEAERKGYSQGLKEKSYEVEELTNHVRELAAFVDPIRPGTWKYYTGSYEYRAFHPRPLYDPATEVESTARHDESRSEGTKNAPTGELREKINQEQSNNEMERERYNEQWQKVVQYAREYATGKGLHRGEPWVRAEFNNYFAWHEQQVEAGRAMSFGGQSGSTHNREVMAEKVYLELRDELSDREAARLRDTLTAIAQDPRQSRGLSR